MNNKPRLAWLTYSEYFFVKAWRTFARPLYGMPLPDFNNAYDTTML